MPSLYLIDGYNVIYHCDRLKSLAIHDFEGARDALVERVGSHCASTGDHAVIVFDGQGRQSTPAGLGAGYRGLEVVYTAARHTADVYIERYIHRAPDRRNIVVVTADHGIRDYCMTKGALVMSPDSFLATLAEATEHLSHKMNSGAHGVPFGRLEDRVDATRLNRFKRNHSK